MRQLRLIVFGAVTIMLGALAFYVIPYAFLAETNHPSSVPSQCDNHTNAAVSASDKSDKSKEKEEEQKNAPPLAPKPPLLGWEFAGAAICLVMMFVGRLASHLSNVPIFFNLVVGGNTQYTAGQLAVQIGLTVLLLVAVAALGYETWAVAQGKWAVTDYVHCAYDSHTNWTIAAAAVLSLVLGNWLWHVTPNEAS
jgi:hypothetical protein